MILIYVLYVHRCVQIMSIIIIIIIIIIMMNDILGPLFMQVSRLPVIIIFI